MLEQYVETITIVLVGSFLATYIYNNMDNIKMMKKHNRRQKYPANNRALRRSDPSNKRHFTSKR